MSGYNTRMISTRRRSISEYAYLTGAQANMINARDYLTEEIQKKIRDKSKRNSHKSKVISNYAYLTEAHANLNESMTF
jgi:hypothetical protein